MATRTTLPMTIIRHLQEAVVERIDEEPVIVLQGARTSGKSTLLRACADARGTKVVDLDDLDTRRAVEADPSYFVGGTSYPVCIDEFQHVPRLLDAIKAELNQDLRPGRYLLTGSTRYMTLPAASQSLAGRAHVMTLWPFSQGELRGRREDFLTALIGDPGSLVSAHPSITSRSAYEEAVLAGGFPLAVNRRPGVLRDRWFSDYVRAVVERDVLEIRNVRQREVVPAVLRLLAGQTAQVLNASRIATQLGLRKELISDYVQLLEAVFLVHRLEAFGRTLSSRVRRLPKVHLVDSGLGAQLLGITPTRLAERDTTTLSEFGHLVETFAVNEVMKQAGWRAEPLRFSHFRTRDGAEVDLVIETGDGRVLGIEVKAASSAAVADFRGLNQLQQKLGDKFTAGVVLHLGQRSFRQGGRLFALPLDRVWG
ncbi:MAG: ATP-binding protein [Candidatus Dormibacteria bacterium]